MSEMDLLNEPERAADLPRDEAVRLLVKVEGLAAALRIAASRTAAEPAKDERDAVTISLDEAARISGLTRKALLRCKPLRAALVKLSGKRLVVNEAKLRTILNKKSCT